MGSMESMELLKSTCWEKRDIYSSFNLLFIQLGNSHGECGIDCVGQKRQNGTRSKVIVHLENNLFRPLILANTIDFELDLNLTRDYVFLARMLSFFDRRHKCRKRECFESSG